VVVDADSHFHGVEPLDGQPPPKHASTVTIRPRDDGESESWSLLGVEGEELGVTTWDDMRYSVLWKAYCFKDEAERTVWRDHTDDLTLDAVLEKLMAELRARAAAAGEPPPHPKDQIALARLLCETYYNAYPAVEENLTVELMRELGLHL